MGVVDELSKSELYALGVGVYESFYTESNGGERRSPKPKVYLLYPKGSTASGCT